MQLPLGLLRLGDQVFEVEVIYPVIDHIFFTHTDT